MSKVTKADLLKEVEELNKKLEEAYESNKRLTNEMAEIQKENKELKLENSKMNIRITKEICEKNELRLEIDSLNNKLRLNHEFYRDNDTMKQKLSETLILSAQKTVKISKLEEKIEELNKNKNVHKIKNERRAGRKERFTDKQKEEIKEYRAQGKSIREIAKVYKCSTGLIHKLINE